MPATNSPGGPLRGGTIYGMTYPLRFYQYTSVFVDQVTEKKKSPRSTSRSDRVGERI